MGQGRPPSDITLCGTIILTQPNPTNPQHTKGNPMNLHEPYADLSSLGLGLQDIQVLAIMLGSYLVYL